jgi:hypothetical protein
MRVLVCGGRDYSDAQKVYDVLCGICPTSIIHGNAAGADDLADSWAKANNVPVIPFPADWGTFGKQAGPIRNQQMLDKGAPELVVAFPGGRGTADMVRRAEAAGIEVRKVE